MELPFMRRKEEPLAGWFGKLPSVGDFVGRGLPAALCELIHGWIAEGVAELPRQVGEDWRDAYQLAPLWHFAMTPGIWEARALLGCVAPSVDRVGRCSPVIALRTVHAENLELYLPPRSQWLHEVDALLRRAIAGSSAPDAVQYALESASVREGAADADTESAGEILAELGISGSVKPGTCLSWPNLVQIFRERPRRSFWWCERSPREPPRQVTHSGDPDADLFVLLLSVRREA